MSPTKLIQDLLLQQLSALMHLPDEHNGSGSGFPSTSPPHPSVSWGFALLCFCIAPHSFCSHQRLNASDFWCKALSCDDDHFYFFILSILLSIQCLVSGRSDQILSLKLESLLLKALFLHLELSPF